MRSQKGWFEDVRSGISFYQSQHGNGPVHQFGNAFEDALFDFVIEPIEPIASSTALITIAITVNDVARC